MILRDELPRENGEHESVNSNENINVAASSPKISYCIKLESIIVEILQRDTSKIDLNLSLLISFEEMKGSMVRFIRLKK